MQTTDLLDSDKIQANLKTKIIGKKIIVFDCTSSTNDIAAEYAREEKNNGLVIFAEEQTAGRGRGGNKSRIPVLLRQEDQSLFVLIEYTGASKPR